MLSVVICTYNRSDILTICLQSIAEFYPKTFAIEVIVVNNNSIDDTSTTLSDFSNTYAWLRIINESQQGLSNARNTGYKSAKHSWILYLDDDAKIEQHLFNRVFTHIKSSTYKCLGGLYLPWYETKKPKWFRDKWASNQLKYSDVQNLQSNEFASGGVLLIHKDLLVAHDGFNPKYGMHGTHTWYGEETELQQRIRKTGNQIAYDPKMIIYHLVPTHKMRVGWQLSSSYQMGKTFLQTAGYPYNIGSGFVALGIGVMQIVLFVPMYLPLLLKQGYYIQNYIIDVLRKPLKWFGAFVSTVTKSFQIAD